MSLFTKIRENRQARKQRRLAAKLHKMIEAAAAENDGEIHVDCMLVVRGDLTSTGQLFVNKDAVICEGVVIDGDVRVNSEVYAKKGIRTNGYCISGGKLTVGGDAHINGRACFDQDVTTYGHIRTLGAVAAVGSVVALGEVSAYGCGLQEAREAIGVDVDDPKRLLRGFDDFLEADSIHYKGIG